MVVPCNFTMQPDADHPERYVWRSHVILCDDHGETWRIGGIVSGADKDECQVVELADGTLMLNMRSSAHERCRVVAMSKDGGETWGESWCDRTLVDATCQGSILRYNDFEAGGRNLLLFSNAASAKARERLTVRLSYDEGKNWPAARVLFAGPAAYSCIAVLPDGKIGCLYEHGRDHPYEAISFARFSVDWLSEGKKND
jgi:sialidase-1